MARPSEYQDDIERVMENYVDETAITDDDIQTSLTDLQHPDTGSQMFKGEGLRVFSEGISNATQPIRDRATQEISRSISPNPSNPETLQVRDEAGRLGISLTDSDGNLRDYDYDVRSDGGLFVVRDDGAETRIDTVDLDDRGRVV